MILCPPKNILNIMLYYLIIYIHISLNAGTHLTNRSNKLILFNYNIKHIVYWLFNISTTTRLMLSFVLHLVY